MSCLWNAHRGNLVKGSSSIRETLRKQFGEIKMMHIDLKKCRGCGQCLDVCPVEAISLVKGKAVIDQDRCIFCGACMAACPQAAISETRSPVAAMAATTHPGGNEKREMIPIARSAGRLAWAVPVLTFLGKEIIPRLVDSFFDSLDRRSSTLPTNSGNLNAAMTNPARGQGRQIRRRRRGRMT